MQENDQVQSVPEDFESFEQYMKTSPEERGQAQESGTEEAAAATEEEAKTAPDSATDEEQEQDPAAEKPKGVQKRIDELTRARRQTERENADLKQRLAALEGSRPQTEKAQRPAEKISATDGEPKIENFDSYQDYYKALVKHEIDAREKTRAAETVAKQAVDTWETKQEAARKAHADYDEALDAIEFKPTAAVPAIREALADSELGAELLYHLAKNPDEVTRITALTPAGAVRELGKLEAKIQESKAPAKTETRKETSAPPPPRRVDGKFASTKAIDDPDLSFEEFEKRMAARRR